MTDKEIDHLKLSLNDPRCVSFYSASPFMRLLGGSLSEFSQFVRGGGTTMLS